MLKRFQVRNFMNFKDTITIDFSNIGGYHFNSDCLTNQLISKMAIYGRNATGKTNLGSALFDIKKLMVGTRIANHDDAMILNADSEESYAEFAYCFQFDTDEITYRYQRTDDTNLLMEELYLNGKRSFFLDYRIEKYSFDDLFVLDAETVEVDRFYQMINEREEEISGNLRDLSFLRWLINNTALRSSATLLKLGRYISNMTLLSTQSSMIAWSGRLVQNFVDKLEDEQELFLFESFLNVMGVDCKLKCQKTPDGRNMLYFVHKNLVPFFETASSGTMSLFNLYRRLNALARASLVYIDEFDAFYHYEMSEKVVEFLKSKFQKSQVVLTTHNTNLLTNRIWRPDCLFILSGNGQLTAFCDATPRELREGHNLEKMYISGEFERYE